MSNMSSLWNPFCDDQHLISFTIVVTNFLRLFYHLFWFMCYNIYIYIYSSSSIVQMLSWQIGVATIVIIGHSLLELAVGIFSYGPKIVNMVISYWIFKTLNWSHIDKLINYNLTSLTSLSSSKRELTYFWKCCVKLCMYSRSLYHLFSSTFSILIQLTACYVEYSDIEF